MLLILNLNFLSHSLHMELTEECKNYFQGECAVSLTDKQVHNTYLHTYIYENYTNENYL